MATIDKGKFRSHSQLAASIYQTLPSEARKPEKPPSLSPADYWKQQRAAVDKFLKEAEQRRIQTVRRK